MRRRAPEDPFKFSKSTASATEQSLKHLLPPALANSQAIGFAVCDRRLRFRLVNKAWARMDGVSPNDHLGATMRSVLGPAAKQFQLPFERVFSSGNPLLGYEFSALFPTQTGETHWITSCFPIKDISERPTLAAALVLETTQLRCFEMWSHKLLADSIPILGTRFATKGRSSGTSLGRPTSATKVRRSEKLSPRERQVIQLLALSKGNKEIATALGISTRTIETYRARIMLKLRVQSLPELVHYAIRNGIVDP
jgi:DNA-binding CsgD family transcriptional regulator